MNILPLGPAVTTKLEERQAPAAEQQGAVAAVASSGVGPRLEPSREDLSAAVRKINEFPAVSAQGLEFSIDEDSQRIVVKVIDQNTREVLRQMPSREALDIARSLDQMRGLLLNRTA